MFNIFFSGIGICIRCGDTQGPWTMIPGEGWICERCEEIMKNEKNDTKSKGNDASCEIGKDEGIRY